MATELLIDLQNDPDWLELDTEGDGVTFEYLPSGQYFDWTESPTTPGEGELSLTAPGDFEQSAMERDIGFLAGLVEQLLGPSANIPRVRRALRRLKRRGLNKNPGWRGVTRAQIAGNGGKTTPPVAK